MIRNMLLMLARHLPHPKPSPQMADAWDYLMRAAKVEPRVALGLLLYAVVFTLPVIYLGGNAISSAPGVINKVAGVIIGLVIGVGFPIVPALLLIVPKLYKRKWVVSGSIDDGLGKIVESYVHPEEATKVEGNYIWKLGGDEIIVAAEYEIDVTDEEGNPTGEVEHWSGPMPWKRDQQLQSDVQIYDSFDWTQEEEIYRPRSNSLIPKLNVALVVVLICVLAFVGLAVSQDPATVQQAAAGV